MIFDSIYYEIKSKSILKGVYLKVESGKICGLFGLNGSGKTTLIKIGAGIMLPTDGTVFIDGEAFIKKELKKRYEKIAYLPQGTFLPKDIDVAQFIGTLSIEARNYVLRHFPANLINQTIASLSGGELRLLEVVFTISLNREFLLLDEPFTGIEPLYIEKMMTLIAEQRAFGKGILITDHYYRYSSQLSDYGYFQSNQECKKLDENQPLTEQLQEHGYLGKPL